MLYLTGAMSHADNAETQTGFAHAHYLWPAFAGDTFKKRFVIMSLQTTSKYHRSIFRIHCQLTNQRGRVVMTCEKTMLFPVEVATPSAVAVAPEAIVSQGGSENDFLRHLVGQTEALHAAGSQVRPLACLEMRLACGGSLTSGHTTPSHPSAGAPVGLPGNAYSVWRVPHIRAHHPLTPFRRCARWPAWKCV